MTLTRRLILFFLMTITLLLGAFSLTLYGIARTHLYGQMDEQAEATLDAFTAAVEWEGDGLEWEPKNRKLLWQSRLETPTWVVFDEHRNRVDGSQETPPLLSGMDSLADDTAWRRYTRVVQTEKPEAVRSRPDQLRYQSLTFAIAKPLAPVQSTLRTLLFAEIAVSIVLWLLAAIGARWACRRALAPVRSMAEAADEMTANDLAERLPVPIPHDELRNLATTFNDLLTRQQVSFERQARFTGEASHQLRTPLAAMLGQLELALRRDRDPDEYRRVIGVGIKKVEQLNQIVDMLLFLSRADSETQIANRQPTDLADLVKAHIADVWANHPRFADIQTDITSKPCVVLIHATAFAQALNNVIDNAFKYSKPGSIVIINVTSDMTTAVVCVSDHGCGVSKAETSHVFEPFFRSAEAKRTGIGGVGLGLAITRRIVEAMGGTIEFGSKVDHGSEVFIQLPLVGEN